MAKGKQKLIDVVIADLIITKNNPRKIDVASEEFAELVANIKGQGVLVPIHVRNSPAADGMHELLAGERRCCAAKAAGLDTIAAVDHGTIDDSRAFEFTFGENFLRKDLTVSEQSRAVGIMLEKFDGNIETVAKRLGKSANWVAMRAKIFGGIVKEIIAKIEEGQPKTWTAGHMARIARLPKETQRCLVESPYMLMNEAPPIKELDESLGGYLHLLNSAPWDLLNGQRVPMKKGGKKLKRTCAGCSDRSDEQSMLWAEASVSDGPQCLNEICWKAKLFAHNKLELESLKSKHGKAKFILSANDAIYSIRRLLSEQYDDLIILGSHQCKWERCGKKADGAICGLIVHGKRAGKVQWIRPAGTGRKSAASKSGSTKVQPGKPLKEKQAELRSKRWQQVLREMVVAVNRSIYHQITHCDPHWFVLYAAAYFGTDSPGMSWKLEYAKFNKGVKAMFENASPDEMNEVLDSLWIMVRPVLAERITYNGPITQVPKKKIDEAKMMAAHLGIDIDAMFEKAKGDIPEPKSWAVAKKKVKKTVKK